MRPPPWFLLASGATVLQVLSLLTVAVTRYVVVFLGPCARALDACELATFVPIHPYLWVGIGLYAAGASLMGVSVIVLRRPPRRAHAVPPAP